MEPWRRPHAAAAEPRGICPKDARVDREGRCDSGIRATTAKVFRHFSLAKGIILVVLYFHHSVEATKSNMLVRKPMKTILFLTAACTLITANLPADTKLVTDGAPLRYLVPTDGSLGGTWRDPGFK